MGHAAIAALPPLSRPDRKPSLAEIFGPALIGTTIIVTFAYFFHIMTFYFVLKWIPKVIHDMGFDASSAAGVLKWANLGGATGGAVLGLLGMRYGMKTLTVGVMIASTIMVNVYGRSPHDLTSLALICACTGFFTNGAIVGMYAIFAHSFPTHLRAFGTGFAIGVGRGGSALGPVIAGYLFDAGYGLAMVATIMSVAALFAALILSLLRMKPDGGESVPSAAGDGAIGASL
jgi:MFS family permease